MYLYHYHIYIITVIIGHKVKWYPLPLKDRTKPGRQIVTFLLICNLAIWVRTHFQSLDNISFFAICADYIQNLNICILISLILISYIAKLIPYIDLQPFKVIYTFEVQKVEESPVQVKIHFFLILFCFFQPQSKYWSKISLAMQWLSKWQNMKYHLHHQALLSTEKDKYCLNIPGLHHSVENVIWKPFGNLLKVWHSTYYQVILSQN